MSFSSNSGPGGVRNLRAMFENKATTEHSTSPPSRGRSPADSEITDKDRQVSRVRASFVAVEKPGELGQAPQWGLRKASDVSAAAGLGEESINAVFSSVQQNKMQGSTSEFQSGGLGMILKGHPFEPSTTAHAAEARDLANLLSSAQVQDKTTAPQKSNGHVVANTAGSIVTKIKESAISNKPRPSPTSQLNTANTARVIKPPATREAQPKHSEKSPVLAKSPKSPKVPAIAPAPAIRGIKGGAAKIRGVMASANRTAAEAPPEPRSPVDQAKSQPAKKDATLKEPATNGINKVQSTSPRTASAPKSPGRPTRLPAAATASTTASIARTENAPPPTTTISKQPPPAGRRTSTTKEKPPPKVASTATASSLAKRAPRASLPAQNIGHDRDRPKSRVSTAKDENFLARMMRPTTSSQQKVHDKLAKPDSPPRGARKASDKARKSLSVGREKEYDAEKDTGLNLETTALIPREEPGSTELKLEMKNGVAIAQDAN